MNVTQRWRLPASALSQACDPAIFNFTSTAEVKPLKGVFGQERAKEALDFGINIKAENYNIFICGVGGTGRHSLLQHRLPAIARKQPAPSDWLYACNFEDEQRPIALSLPAGQGHRFQKALNRCVQSALEQAEQAMHSEDLVNIRAEKLKTLFAEANQRLAKMEKEAQKQGFTIMRQGDGFTPVPTNNGEPLGQEQFMALSEPERGTLMQRSMVLQDRINEAVRQYKQSEYRIQHQLQSIEKEAAAQVVKQSFAAMMGQYAEHELVISYLQKLQEDLAEHASMLLASTDDNSGMRIFRQMEQRNLLRRYQVNLLVDNQDQKHAPIIYESKPDYNRLFGQINHEGEFGILSTDFTHIRAGALHRANGGYLILNAADVLQSYYVWNELKQVLRTRQLRVENLAQVIGMLNSKSLDVESIPVDLKVILIGDLWIYYQLYELDEDFRRLFRVRVDFETEMKRDRRHMRHYAEFIASVCEQECMCPFSPDAVARVVEYGSRLVDNQRKLSASFDRIKEIVCEASVCATRRKAELVTEEDVKAALRAKKRRASRMEERLFEQMQERMLLIDTTGQKIGEINGLAVYDTGDYIFARPMRITAKAYRGGKGLVNIERETQMSGKIHSKGILTLSGYLGGMYAQEQPLSLSASLTFEQSYSGIEGDSASSAELCALLSSLGQFSIDQGIAVTGSVNQNGEIQPIGGVNEKIEAFFWLCQYRGLKGSQGVIIPQQNTSDLMLDEEVSAAVKAGHFSIWAVEHIEQMISILSGLDAGILESSGRFTPHSIHDRVDQRLREFYLQGYNRLIAAEEPVSSRVLRRRKRR